MSANPTENPNRKDFDILRKVLLEPEQNALDQLSHPDTWLRHVSQVLPEALVKRAKTDPDLKNALAPILEESLSILIKRNPKDFAELLFPVMLPAIRRAVSSMFSSLVQNFNTTLDQAFSVQGLKWRLESISTGRPFAEVVLSHTLVYRTEQVLLIHRETGLMIENEVSDGVEAQDGSMVSGMLTAIGDFARDSFDPNAALNTVDMGERTLVIEQSSKLILACLVLGDPNPELKNRMQDALADIHISHVEEIANYNGDNQPFVKVQPLLSALFEAKYVDASKSKPPYAMAAILSLVVLGGALWGLNIHNKNVQWAQIVGKLQREPGLIITDASRRNVLHGLKDPLARDPNVVIGSKAAKIKQDWSPVQSLDPQIVARRVRSQLAVPDTVTVAYDNEKLVFQGTCDNKCATELRPRALALGYQSVDGIGLNQFAAKLKTLTKEISNSTIYFAPSSVKIRADQSISFAVLKEKLANLKTLTDSTGAPILVTAVGHADGQSSTQQRSNLALGRARNLATDLSSVFPMAAEYTLELIADGSDGSNAAKNRMVSFVVEETSP